METLMNPPLQPWPESTYESLLLPEIQEGFAMKVAIPGRAMKMQQDPPTQHKHKHVGSPDKIHFNNIEIRPAVDFLAGKEGGKGTHCHTVNTHFNITQVNINNTHLHNAKVKDDCADDVAHSEVSPASHPHINNILPIKNQPSNLSNNLHNNHVHLTNTHNTYASSNNAHINHTQPTLTHTNYKTYNFESRFAKNPSHSANSYFKSPSHSAKISTHSTRPSFHSAKSPSNSTKSFSNSQKSPSHSAKSPSYSAKNPFSTAKSPSHSVRSSSYSAKSFSHSSKSPSHSAKSSSHSAKTLSHFAKSPSHSTRSLSLTHNGHPHSNSHGEWRRTARLYKKELKAKGNIRPSTAVRRHVKKISEEFSLTQTKYEKATGSVEDGKAQNQASTPTVSTSSVALNPKIPPSKTVRNVLSKITCNKCEPEGGRNSRKNLMAPFVTCSAPSDPTPSTTPRTMSAKSPGGKSKSGPVIPPRESTSPQKRPSTSLSPPGSSPRPRHRLSSGRGGGEGLVPPTSPSSHRSLGKRSVSSLAGVSPRSKQMTFEQIRKVKMFTEKAILEGRVFSIFGYFPAIKEALRRRGFVEKMQHSPPYVNPHPNNCVCPHVGYHSIFAPPPPVAGTTTTTTTAATTTTSNTSTTANTTTTTNTTNTANTTPTSATASSTTTTSDSTSVAIATSTSSTTTTPSTSASPMASVGTNVSATNTTITESAASTGATVCKSTSTAITTTSSASTEQATVVCTTTVTATTTATTSTTITSNAVSSNASITTTTDTLITSSTSDSNISTKLNATPITANFYNNSTNTRSTITATTAAITCTVASKLDNKIKGNTGTKQNKKEHFLKKRGSGDCKLMDRLGKRKDSESSDSNSSSKSPSSSDIGMPPAPAPSPSTTPSSKSPSSLSSAQIMSSSSSDSTEDDPKSFTAIVGSSININLASNHHTSDVTLAIPPPSSISESASECSLTQIKSSSENDEGEEREEEGSAKVPRISESLPHTRHNINTAILAPSEIRKGLAQTITEKNASIFKYTVKHIPRRRSIAKPPEMDEPAEEESAPDDDSEENGDDDDEGETEALPTEEEEVPRVPTPEPYNPYVDFQLSDLDMPLVARLLRNVEPNLLWTWTRDTISFKHLSREQVVNRFPSTPFTTKYGLCETLQQLHWFSEAASVDTFVPRGYCIGHEDERNAFLHDYRLTACLNVLKWVTERHDTYGPQAVSDPHGEVPMKRVRQALSHVEQFIQSCCHDDLDAPPPPSLREHEWDALITAHYRIVHTNKKIKLSSPSQLQSLVLDCESALRRVVPFWPQLPMDGVRNLWIVKPGAQSRGRGIFLMNHLEEILALVQSPLIYETKYVVQKYMERPLLIHNTKFDIRQWFLVTDWNPLHVWVYRECYLRFCSQQYDLTNSNEAVHLSNNAIQCKYLNGERSEELPEENMWDMHQFREYLGALKKEKHWDEVIYPGMRDALVAAMLAAQVEMDTFKHGFELFGADFMLTEDLKPWLIEINSSPCMAATTSVTRRMCAQCLQDVIKVVVDYRNNRTADTGLFELAYRDSERSIPNPPYLGVNLQVVGRQIKQGPPKHEKRKSKKSRPAERQVRPLPLITMSLEEGPHHTLHAHRDPPREPTTTTPPGGLTRHCSLLDCRKYINGSTTSLPISSDGTQSDSSGTKISNTSPGYLESSGPRVSMSSSGYLDSNGKRVSSASPGYLESNGPKISTTTSGYLESSKTRALSARPGYLDSMGTRNSASSLGDLDFSGPMITIASSGYLDSNGTRLTTTSSGDLETANSVSVTEFGKGKNHDLLDSKIGSSVGLRTKSAVGKLCLDKKTL